MLTRQAPGRPVLHASSNHESMVAIAKGRQLVRLCRVHDGAFRSELRVIRSSTVVAYMLSFVPASKFGGSPAIAVDSVFPCLELEAVC